MSLTEKLFARMQGIYNHKWTSSLANEEIYKISLEEWSLGLAGIEISKIKSALDICRTKFKWPPSICEFLETCEDVTINNFIEANNVPSIQDCKRLFNYRHNDLWIGFEGLHEQLRLNLKDKTGFPSVKEIPLEVLNKIFPTAYREVILLFISLPPQSRLEHNDV